MSILLMKLRGVPEDELHDIRHLLEDARIDFYETSAGMLGISLPGLWLSDESRYQEASELLNEYQQNRYRQAREKLEQDRQQGTARGWASIFLENPLRFILYTGIILFLIYLTTIPWFDVGNSS